MRRRHLFRGWSCVALLILALPAGADWLITLDGKLIETRGPWTIEGGTLTYMDLEGEEHTLDVDDVDLEASEETTALRAGKPYEPAAATAAAPAPSPEPGRRKAKGEEPKVILYMTSLCSECTRVRELLDELAVAYVEKDINTSAKARREYDKKAGHGGGLPVLDIDGRMVFRPDLRVIRQRVREFQEREAAAAAEEAEAAKEPEPREEHRE